MKRFVFKLQPLLKIKLALEKEQLARLAECDALLRRLEDELAAMRQSFEDMRQDYNEKAASGMPVHGARDFVNGFDHLRDATRKKRGEIEVATQKRLQIQLKLVEIKRDIKVYEKLRDKQYEEYQKEVRAEEDKLVGDILSYKVSTR